MAVTYEPTEVQRRRSEQSGRRLPANLRLLRRQRDLTLEAVAAVADVDAATVSRIERGIVRPQPETVVRLARGLGISVGRMAKMIEATATTCSCCGQELPDREPLPEEGL